jgi:hypothetical protein
MTRKILTVAAPLTIAASLLIAATPRTDSSGRPLPGNVRCKGDPPPVKDGGK